ncbi:MAG: hypothetical protein K1X53_01500, partial [Candidatus Sumerlaeaceae bacterium]|nr:hypothetical protein [Candidatus Sumerlaeaceae bacterium]
MPRNKKGIFCLEGDWSRHLEQSSSVEPILALMAKWEPHYVPYIHRNVSTKESLRSYLGLWARKHYRGYPLLYLAFHGNPGVICLGNECHDGNQITLDLLEDYLRGKCSGRIIYFGSCGTLGAHGN